MGSYSLLEPNWPNGLSFLKSILLKLSNYTSIVYTLLGGLGVTAEMSMMMASALLTVCNHGYTKMVMATKTNCIHNGL